MKLLLFSCLLFPLISLAQKDQKLFKSDQSWEDAYAVKEKSAPAGVQQKLVQLREKGSKEGWTFQVGYTSVINKDLRRITGLVIPSEKDIKANPKLYEPDPGYSKMLPEPNIIPAQCVANARRFDAREHGWVTPVRDQADCGSCWAFGAVAAFETSFLIKNGGNASVLDLSEQQVVNCIEHTAWGCWNGGMTSAGVGEWF